MKVFYLSFRLLQWDLWSKKVFPVFLFLLLFFPICHAQSLVKNINSGAGSTPDDMIELGGYVYFSADDGSTGEELWRSDGTEAGTTQVMDIRVGAVGSAISNMVEMNGKIYFSANNGTKGYELWMTDGTTTEIVLDIVSGASSSSPTELYVYSNTLYFSAYNAANGKELWKSTGAVGNASLVSDINSGSANSNPANMYGFGGFIYFSATTASAGTELWKSDGTTTSLVLDIYPGSSNSNPAEFMEFDGDLYFSAEHTANNKELWKVEGTTGIAALFADINPGTSVESVPTELTVLSGVLYFIATNATYGQEIFKTDGTTTGIAVDLKIGVNGSYPQNITVFGSNFYYIAWVSGQYGRELYKSDGSTTTLLKDINDQGSPGTDDAFNSTSTLNSLKVYNNRLFFNATNGVNGNEPWMSDGTSAGTVMLRDINTVDSPSDSSPDNFIVANGYLFFRADGGGNDTELMQIGNCDPGETPPFVTDAGTYQSLYEKTDGTGWTHYCDCQNNLLLSVEKDATVVIPTENVSVNIGATPATYHVNGCSTTNCFITNALGAVVFNRSWNVDPTTQPAVDVAVRFYFPDAEYTAVNTELTNQSLAVLPNVAGMSFFKVTDGGVAPHANPEDIPSGSATVLVNGVTPSTTEWVEGTYGTDHYAEMMVASFSGGGGGGGPGGSSLPVELIYFKARPQQDDVYLEWSTASEFNNAGFIIERSKNAMDWETLDFVGALGESEVNNIYSYVDHDPFIGTSYYRLRQRDFDGSEELTNVEEVYMEMLVLGEPSPNPVLESASVFVDVNLDLEQEVEVLLIDGNGSVAKRERVNLSRGVQRMEIDCQNLTRGLYHLRLTVNKEAYHRTFVIESVR